MKTSLTIAILLLLLITTCKPKPSPPDLYSGPYYLNEVRDYIYFKPGTWWLYENSHTLTRDCVYVTRTDTAFVRVKHQKSKDGDPYYHYVDYTAFQSFMYSTYNKCELRLNSWGVGTEGFTYGIQKSYTCQLPHSNSSLLFIFTYPFNTSGIDFSTSEIINNVKVKDNTYNNVVVFENRSESDLGLIPMNDRTYDYAYKPTYYWAKNYGIIKSTITTQRLDDKKSFDASWELIKSNIIQ